MAIMDESLRPKVGSSGDESATEDRATKIGPK